MLNGSLEQDKLFSTGDKALVRINFLDGEILNISMIDHYRAPWELLLAALFVLLLVAFAGWTGHGGHKNLCQIQILVSSVQQALRIGHNRSVDLKKICENHCCIQ